LFSENALQNALHFVVMPSWVPNRCGKGSLQNSNDQRADLITGAHLVAVGLSPEPLSSLARRPTEIPENIIYNFYDISPLSIEGPVDPRRWVQPYKGTKSVIANVAKAAIHLDLRRE